MTNTKKYTNSLQNHVEDFHIAFNHPTSNTPTPISLERATNRAIWTTEEQIEFIAASSTNKEEFTKAYYTFKEGLDKAFQKSLDSDFPQNDIEKIIAQADALTDTDYFVKGSFVELGVDEEPIFNIVQSANMSKLFTDENGNKYAKYREDGKIQKSPDFYSPEPFIKEEVLRQLNNN